MVGTFWLGSPLAMASRCANSCYPSCLSSGVHETSLTWKDTNIFNNDTPNKVAKNNDRAASIGALVHAHAHILADHVTRSIGYIASQKTCYLSCSFARYRVRKRRHLG